MVGVADFDVAQPFSRGIDPAQPSLNRQTVIEWDEGISRAADAGELATHMGQQVQRGRSTPWAHGADASAVEVKCCSHLRQRGRQQRGMAAEAETNHIDRSRRTTLLQPSHGCGEITKDLRRRGGVLMTPSLGQCTIGIIQIQIRGRPRKQGQCQGRDPLGRETLGYIPDPGIHTKHLR